MDLRAQSIAEAVIRQEEILKSDFYDQDPERALLADLEFLATRERAITEPPTPSKSDKSVHFGRTKTATERRAEVVKLLSSLDAATMSDREIARRVGCGPQTVGNICRRIAERREPHSLNNAIGGATTNAEPAAGAVPTLD
jgi:DNA-binding CsgD family transcriptional regulator